MFLLLFLRGSSLRLIGMKDSVEQLSILIKLTTVLPPAKMKFMAGR